jgi:transposase
MGLAASTVRAIDLRFLERWEAGRRKPALRHMGVDEIYRGKKGKFLTVVCNLETGAPLWFGRDRKKETLDEFFRSQLVSRQRKRIEAACVDLWEPFRLSIEQWAPGCKIVYDKFHNYATRQRRYRRSTASRVLPSRQRQARIDQGEEVVVDESMADRSEARRTEPAVRPEPAHFQGLSAERKPGTTGEL